MSNEVWTANTVVPRVQHASARAWARLFGLPLISAINSVAFLGDETYAGIPRLTHIAMDAES
jgi:hypothetical protein